MDCPKCNFSGDKECVISHHTKVHIKGIKYECNKCNSHSVKRFDTAKGYVYHMREKHSIGIKEMGNNIIEEFKKESRNDSIKAEHVSENPENREEFKCENCGTTFTQYPSRSGGEHPKFCSQECHLKSESHKNRFSGKNNPNYVDGESENRDYGSNWEEQREKARERDFYQCRVCRLEEKYCKDKYGCELHVHHKTPFVNFNDNDRANRLKNLITVCPKCHSELEKELSS